MYQWLHRVGWERSTSFGTNTESWSELKPLLVVQRWSLWRCRLLAPSWGAAHQHLSQCRAGDSLAQPWHCPPSLGSRQLLKRVHFGGNTAFLKERTPEELWEGCRVPVMGMPVLQCWCWQGRCRRGRAGCSAASGTLPAVLPVGARLCCSAVGGFVIHSPSCKLCWVYLPTLTEVLEQQKSQRIDVLKSVSSKLAAFKFLSSQGWKPALLGLLPLTFSSQAGISFEILLSCFK